MPDDLSNRSTFNEVAVLYDKARPTYPDLLFSRLIDVANLPPKAKLVEIGPGTGQATRPLAEYGYEIIAVELGKDLADVARDRLRKYSNVTVVTGSFEQTDLPEQGFDLVFSASAFHWVKRESRYAKPHTLLKPTGYLAIIHRDDVSDEQGDLFFNASQSIYSDYYGDDGEDKPKLPAAADVQPTELDGELFKLVDFSCFPVAMEYTATQYAELLNTYSPTLALPEDQRRSFLADIETLIDTAFSGKVTRQFVMSLTVAEPIKP